MSKQLKLFEARAAYRVEQPKKLMSKDALLKWKARIFQHQRRTLDTQPPQQMQIFDLPRAKLWDEQGSSFASPRSHCDANAIDPFTLKLHNAQFYRLKEKEYQEKICIYFIIDNALPLLLYVGETKQTARQRWNGTHDCKDYVMNYIELHRKYDLEVKICSAFWYDTPENRTGRLRLESALIKRWESPFNKENWGKYGKPFGKI